jgi:fatty acid-binding protein DegV
VADAVELMAAHVRGAAAVAARADQRLRVGIGHGAAAEIAGELRRRVDEIPEIEEVIEYVVGPSIGAHLGPGNAGAVFVARPIA